MTRDAQLLLALGASLAFALAGIATLIGGSTRRAELVVRGGDAPSESRVSERFEVLDAGLRRTRAGERLHVWLRSAGATVSVADFLGLLLAGAVVAGLVLLLLFPPLPAALVGVALSIGTGKIWGERARGQRSEAFIQQLPEIARTLSNASAAGLSMIGAVQLAARELAEPARTEMRAVVQEMRLGRSLEDALESMRGRLPSREAAVLVSTIAIQQRAGGDTVRALQELSDTLDARKDLRREVRTLLSGTVYTSYLVAAMGVGTLFLLNLISPGVLREMASSGLGIAAFAAAGTMWAIAFVLIKRTTRVDL